MIKSSITFELLVLLFSVSLGECPRHVLHHQKFLNVFGDSKTDSEIKLILARAGENTSTFLTISIIKTINSSI